MILIADGGSTKCDWAAMDYDGKEVLRTQTLGLNPYLVTTEKAVEELSKNAELTQISNKIKHVFFYGAGCSSKASKFVLEKAFTQIFTQAQIHIDHDMLGAAYAAYNGKPAIVCILGTGSNSCYFDGKNLREDTESLGWILGDEGSGSNLGKRLLLAHFVKKMPPHLEAAFNKSHNNLTVDEVNENVYKKTFPNAYVAGFSRFVVEHKYEPFMQNLIYQSMKEFVENQVLVYPEARFSEINFIGSIAHYYEETLHTVCAENHLVIGSVLKRPIDSLVKYHLLYIIPNLK
ncbi:MAG: ATPase [Flavobacteriaceae bacterium]|jgi:N-acetylglucosamine kinase-like BadF-type ATPase|nr:ATPase [Flavobacteriaceae bacterium]